MDNCLLEWAREVGHIQDVSILNLEVVFLKKIDLATFFINELKYLRNSVVIEKIFAELKSHKVINGLFIKLLMQQKLKLKDAPSADYIDLLIRTFHPSDINFTKQIFEKIYKHDRTNYEYGLKKFIIGTSTVELSELFFASCHTVDSKYIDCFFKCDKSKLRNNLNEISNSRYFNLLTIELETFKFVIERLEDVENAINIFSNLHLRMNLCRNYFP